VVHSHSSICSNEGLSVFQQQPRQGKANRAHNKVAVVEHCLTSKQTEKTGRRGKAKAGAFFVRGERERERGKRQTTRFCRRLRCKKPRLAKTRAPRVAEQRAARTHAIWENRRIRPRCKFSVDLCATSLLTFARCDPFALLSDWLVSRGRRSTVLPLSRPETIDDGRLSLVCGGSRLRRTLIHLTISFWSL